MCMFITNAKAANFSVCVCVFLAMSNGPLINLINTPIMDDQAYKLLTVEVLMVSLCYLLGVL